MLDSDKSNFKDKTFKSVFWKFIERGLTNGVQFLIGIILARLLLPSDYGVIAILGIFIAVSQTIIDSGLSQVVIQNQNRTEDDFSVMFITNFLLSLVLYVILYFTAPYIAEFYKLPILIEVTRVYSLILIINTISIVSKTRNTIKLKFKIQARITVSSIIISGVIGIIMAFRGLGVWALVCQQLLNAILQSVSYLLIEKSVTQWHYPLNKAKEIFTLGYKLLIANLLHTFYSNTQPLLIGKFYQPSQLGFYSRGDQMIKIIPMNVSDVFSNTMFPVFCQYKDNESLDMFRERFFKYIRLIAFLFFPIMFLLIALAKPLVLLLLTEKWEQSIIFMQILGFAYMLDPIMRLNACIPTVFGRTDIQLKNETIKKIVALLLIFIGALISISAMCWGMVIYSIFDILITTHFIKKIIGTSFFDELKILVRPLLYNAAILLFLILINQEITNNILMILVDIIFYGCTYFFILWKFPVEEIDILKQYLRKRI